MVVEAIDGDIKFIHFCQGGVMISSVREKYYRKKVTQINLCYKCYLFRSSKKHFQKTCNSTLDLFFESI
jgi:hypothetical protein